MNGRGMHEAVLLYASKAEADADFAQDLRRPPAFLSRADAKNKKADPQVGFFAQRSLI
jgi:hypothetical protein